MTNKNPVPRLVLLPGMDGTGYLYNPRLNTLGSSIQAQIVNYPTNETKTYKELTLIAKEKYPADGDWFC